MAEPGQTGGAPTEGPRFRVVWRGYDRHQVDEYVRRSRNGTAPATEPVDRELSPIDQQLAEFFAAKDAPRMFDVAFRGYDRNEVDRYLEQFDR
jgi:cell division septum initiation protein DivIVA